MVAVVCGIITYHNIVKNVCEIDEKKSGNGKYSVLIKSNISWTILLLWKKC